MLSDRITLLMSSINAETADIAELAGFDRSNISRMKSGARVPKKNGRCMDRFVEAMIDFAENCGKCETLCSVISYEGEFSRSELHSYLLEWLYGEPILPKLKEKHHDPEAKRCFGKKLDTLMDILEISNVKLSKAVNIDPSYLSRMRTGKCLPNERSKVLERICNVLISRVADKGKMSDLSEAVNIPAEFLSSEPRLLMEWMLSSKETAYKAPVGQLLNTIEYIDIKPDIPVLDFDISDFASELSDTSVQYNGIEGLRSAVIRFLGTTIRSGDQLLLYSDQSMEWMNGDFRKIWLALMIGVLKKGVHIKIIHNIERNSTEMLEAISSWMPLYMSGLIEPYYCLKRQGERFGHTFFLDTENSCIEGVCVNGFENSCTYRYITDKTELAQCRMQFDSLLSECRPLVMISRDIHTPSENGIHKTIGGIHLDIMDNKAVISRLSAPYYSFSFDHPLLLGAFRSFVL